MKGERKNLLQRLLVWREKNIKVGNPEVRDLKAEKIRKEIELLTERHLGEKRNNEIEAGELWRKSEVLAAYKSTLAKVRAQLDAKLRVDLPARCAGQPAEVIEAAIGEALDAAYAAISKP